MKRLIEKSKIITIVLFLLTTSFTWSSINEIMIDVPVSGEDLIGTYDYTVDGVPYEYSKGVIIIGKQKAVYTVKIKLDNGELNGEDVKVEGNSITFNVFIEGRAVAVELTVEGDGISGESNSYDGTFMIKGKRRA